MQGRIEYLSEVESTQSYLHKLLEREELPLGYTVFAGRQTRGRGRRGRSFWLSPEGGLPFSSWFPFPGPSELFPWLTVAAGVAVCEVVERWVQVYLRWPNDVVSRTGRKLAGILCEAVTRDHELRGAIVGVGINLFFAPGEPPEELRERAISLKDLVEEGGDPQKVKEVVEFIRNDPQTRRALIEAWLERMVKAREELLDPQERAQLFQRYNRRLLPELRRVTVNLEGITKIGYIISIHPQGRLRFLELNGTREYEVRPEDLLADDLP